jgi:hypothetical protein
MPDLKKLDRIANESLERFNQEQRRQDIVKVIKDISRAAADLEQERRITREALQEPYTV